MILDHRGVPMRRAIGFIRALVRVERRPAAVDLCGSSSIYCDEHEPIEECEEQKRPENPTASKSVNR